MTTNDKHLGTKIKIRIIGIIAVLVFELFLPYLWWEITWPDLFHIVFNNSKEIQISNTLTKVLQSLGVLDKNLHSWAFERILICAGIGIALIIIICILTKETKENKKNENSN